MPMDMDRLAAIQAELDYHFGQPAYLARALTHSSYANEHELALESNERLEFLGDAVLELAISECLFQRFPMAHEGQLTRIRSRLVKEKTLAQRARDLGLDRLILLGRGEESQGGRDRDSVLADALEALLGAVFLDGGYLAAREFVSRTFQDLLPETADLPKVKDYKTRLQEITQQRFKIRPIYAQLGTSGPDHARIYEVEVRLPEGASFAATGASLKRAEQNAARLAIEHLGED
ncbi:ribonuclease III [Desulfocurvibacter africanus]|uniref:Ribonuclease 3 n=1 Tax=Desulfocurvibacter africanus subsp. africanus str. Walvis Bay TaxID=690850 RepID=F3YYH6_DESAF|nr:ribonuclease III [Desulfocurvibacter africanus]EGJ50730.1 Ribonuclease 3 [Desulfocurvibacter africanus subsp. africanus str. Walvis Bay]